MAKTQAKTKAKALSKTELYTAVTEAIGDEVSKKQVRAVFETLAAIAQKELKKNGLFVVPGFAKFVVVKKPARPARNGINPFTKEPTTFAAKPVSKGIKARPVKALKDVLA